MPSIYDTIRSVSSGGRYDPPDPALTEEAWFGHYRFISPHEGEGGYDAYIFIHGEVRLAKVARRTEAEPGAPFFFPPDKLMVRVQTLAGRSAESACLPDLLATEECTMPNGCDDPITTYDDDDHRLWSWQPDHEGRLVYRLANDNGFIFHANGEVPSTFLLQLKLSPLVVSLFEAGQIRRLQDPDQWREFLDEAMQEYRGYGHGGDYTCVWYGPDFLAMSFVDLAPDDPDDWPEDLPEFAFNLSSGEFVLATTRPLSEGAARYGWLRSDSPQVDISGGSVVVGNIQTNHPLHMYLDDRIRPEVYDALFDGSE